MANPFTRMMQTKKQIRQFGSYLVVGGTATVVEWGLFWLFVYGWSWGQNFSFTIAYILSTFVNLIMGKKMTFKNAAVVGSDHGKAANFLRETALIYLVALLGLLANLLFLNVFTIVFHMNSMLSKVVTTGIVFIGNYLARKLGIYREKHAGLTDER